MIIVADSGSTKTDWIAVDEKGNELHRVWTEGYNPMIVKPDYILKSLRNSGLDMISNQVEEVYFYGAGCSTEETKQRIARPLSAFFNIANVEVEHDLLAAARAVCAEENGIVVILGTGSNSCLYRGGEIVNQVPNLGYLLGDEGAGCTLGKKIVTAYMYGELSDKTTKLFESETNIDKSSFVSELYASEVRNRFLASFAPFCVKYRNIPEVRSIVLSNLEEFVLRHLVKYNLKPNEKVNAIGSISALLSNEFEQVLQKHGLQLGVVVKNPIQRLVEYHLKN